MKKALSVIVGIGAVLLSSEAAFAQINPPGTAINPSGITPIAIAQFIILFLFAIGLIIALGFLIYGGIKWVLSGGDKTAVEGARNHIVAAVVGIAIIAGAFVIINLVFFILTGHGFDPTKICIPTLQSNTCSTL